MFTNEDLPKSVVHAEKLALYILRASAIRSTDAHATHCYGRSPSCAAISFAHEPSFQETVYQGGAYSKV
jgi:hypothetical protein